MKKFSNSIFAKVLLILIGISFVVVGGISGGLSTGSSVAKVEDEKISFAEFYRSYRYQSRQLGMDPTVLQQLNYANIVLDGLIRDVTTFAKAKSLGLVATDASLAKQVRENDSFQLAGVFDEQQYNAVLQSNGLDSDSYLDNLKKSESVKKYLNTFQVFGLSIPTSVDALYKSSEQSRTLIKAEKSFADIANPTVTETDLNTYYSDNQQAFEVPETRSVTAIYLDNTSVANSISDDDAKIFFEQNSSDFDTPETRSYYTITGSKEDLNAIITSVNTGTDIATAVQDVLNKDITSLLTENASRDSIDTILQGTVFGTDAGKVSHIVSGPFSNILVYVNAVNTGQQAQFNKVVSDVKQAMAFDRIFDMTVNIEDSIADDTSLEDIARKIGVPVTHVDITNQGNTDFVFTTNATFTDTIFDIAEGDVSDVLDLGNETFVVARLNTIKPVHIPALNDIKQQVTDRFITDVKTDVLNAELEKLANSADRNAFIAHAQQLGFKTTNILNQKASELTDTSLVDAFNIKVGSVTSNIDNETAMAVFAVSRIVPTEVPADAKQNFDNIVKTSTYNSLIYNIQSDLMEKTPAKINQARVNSVYGGGQ